MTTDTPALPPMPAIELTLPIEGMTCASCSNRVERFLRKTDGVLEANVNLATEQAHVRFDPTVVGRDELMRAVEDAGYGVREAAPEDKSGALDAAAAADAERRARETRRLGYEAATAIVVGAAMMAATLWLTPLVALEQLNWLLLVPATLVQFGLGRRFYAAAGRAARHGSANMSTLVVLGTTAAWLYSAVVTLFARLCSRCGPRADDLLRQRGRHHRPRPVRPLARGACQESDGRSRAPARRSATAHGARRARGH